MYDQLYIFSLTARVAPSTKASTHSGRILNATFNAHSCLRHPSIAIENQIGKLFAAYAGAVKSTPTDSEVICEASVVVKIHDISLILRLLVVVLSGSH